MILHPIAKLMAIAKQIGAGDFKVRIKVRSRDEIGERGGAINEMAGHLKNAYGELQSEIVERKRAESEVTRTLEQIKAQAAELAMANKVKSEFLSVMSHELRTPLNVILGHTWLLREKAVGEISAEQDESLAGVEKQARLLLTMVNSILETTRIEAEASKVDKTTVSLDRLFDDLRASCAVLIHDKLTLVWDYHAHIPSIVTDRNKLYTVLWNLVENAIKFTPEGSVAVSARVCGELDVLEISVRDTGLGIAEENVASIFNMFHQVDSSDTRMYAGLGLGLYIVKKFVDLLSGAVEVESVLGQGSLFTVRLPFEGTACLPVNGDWQKHDERLGAFDSGPRR
jgi:signal transduction histidine kinase